MTEHELMVAGQLAEAGELDEAWKIADDHLTYTDPNDYRALMIATVVHEKAKRLSEAYQFAKRATEEAPNKARVWLNLGHIAEELYRFAESEKSYMRCLKMCKDDKQKLIVLCNLSAMYVQQGDFGKGLEWSKKALAIDPNHRKSRANLGLAQLAMGDWREGWKNYDAIIGAGDQRKKKQYATEPEWDGSRAQTVAVYGEQGLGDEISFCSMIPDLCRDAGKVIIDCDERLHDLFTRSFPMASVYGTRWSDLKNWKEEDKAINSSVSMGGLGKFYRPSADSCPGTPYLVADPDRVAMWKGLWATKRKPVIGIAWSGGTKWTGARFRRWTLEDLRPLFESIDAHWVVLQYKDATQEVEGFKSMWGVDIHQYPWGTLTNNYDDVAGLVASLDCVVSMQTSVIHLAGALGVKTHCFVHKHGQWRYGTGKDSIPWYNSVKLYRQKQNDSWPIKECAEDVARQFSAPKILNQFGVAIAA